jgi:PTH1 family peptidyl-tRNA hydrolase
MMDDCPSIDLLTFQLPMCESKVQFTLIVGLGNPGRKYARNRHNAGFLAIDRLARRHGLSFARRKGKAKIAEGKIAGQRVILAKPQTYMNLSGESVAALVRFFKIPACRALAVYDDLDLPLARLRLRPEGGSGGHKGLKSVTERLGTQAFPRLRIGIGRPVHGDPMDFVLQDFTVDEWIDMDAALDCAVKAIEHWLLYGIDAAMNVFNRPSDGPDSSKADPDESLRTALPG